MTSRQWSHDYVRNQHPSSHHFYHGSYTRREVCPGNTDGQKKPYPYYNHHHLSRVEDPTSPKKRFSCEVDGPTPVTPTKHSRYFWQEPHAGMDTQPRRISYSYHDYSESPSASTAQTPRMLLPAENYDRSTRTDVPMLQPHDYYHSSYQRDGRYNEYKTGDVSHRYSYPPEHYRPHFVPISPTASPSNNDRCPDYFCKRSPGDHRHHSAYYQGEHSGSRVGSSPSSANRYHQHTSLYMERRHPDYHNQSRDDVETVFRVSSKCSDDSRDCHEGYYYEGRESDHKLGSSKDYTPTGRTYSSPPANLNHNNTKRSSSGLDASFDVDFKDTRDHTQKINLSSNLSPNNSLHKAATLPKNGPTELCHHSLGAEKLYRHHGGSGVSSRAEPVVEREPPEDNFNQKRSEISDPPSPIYNTALETKASDLLSDTTSLLLLSLPEDKAALSKSLCVVRQNVEVFCATAQDVVAPAPGRKNPIVVGQVGLRCIHCRHISDRVKRAVCYPSSLRRIYRTVTDMKLDHFTACPGVPQEIKGVLDELKISSSRSTSTTMKYFIDSAIKLGLIDTEHGLRFRSDAQPAHLEGKDEDTNLPENADRPVLKPIENDSTETMKLNIQDNCPKMINLISTSRKLLGEEIDQYAREYVNVTSKSIESETENDDPDRHESSSDRSTSLMEAAHMGTTDDATFSDHESLYFSGCVPLNQKEDRLMLSPLRCFLRENVYAFSATEEDISARTPTNFSVVKGQVGICCKYCYKLSAKERSNRAVCFPFSIDRLYQSVADLQRFHFTACNEIPQDIKEKFENLKSSSSKGSKGLATRQYWITSAKKLGLIDSPTGIKFGRDPLSVAAPAVSLDILAQVAVELTARHPLVVPDDQNSIAEFLYFVMSQLQPCRFTEADRNKRRMKEVGCIGVECKHCVGQAESRKFFWSSANAVESNFISVHTHLMDCQYVPTTVKEKITELKGLRKEHSSKLKNGSQKAFFARVWTRLHEYSGMSTLS
jgi:hypothetical protein